MDRRREDAGRQPQFTESHYEIPSWQTPWSIPWYQRTDSSNNESEKPRTYKYNSRGHLTDCNCTDCEEDLETAFSPQSNPNLKTLFDIPRDRREEIKIQNVEPEENGGNDESTSIGKKLHNSCDAPKRVYMFSELAEVPQTTTSDASNSEPRSSSASFSDQQDRGATSMLSSNRPSNGGASMTQDSVMDPFGFMAIQAVLDQNQDIQERVRNYRGKSNTQEYRAMKGLLESLLRELNRINSPLEWIATTKAVALEGIKRTLFTLEQKVKDADS